MSDEIINLVTLFLLYVYDTFLKTENMKWNSKNTKVNNKLFWPINSFTPRGQRENFLDIFSSFK